MYRKIVSVKSEISRRPNTMKSAAMKSEVPTVVIVSSTIISVSMMTVTLN